MELWDVYNIDGTKTGKIVVRGEYAFLSDEYHLLTEAWIVNSKHQVLIQKRAPDKNPYPDMWEKSAGGSVVSGEDSFQACIREVSEELGMVPDMQKAVSVGRFVRKKNVMADVWLITEDVDIKNLCLQEQEVAAVKWADFAEIDDLLAQGVFVPDVMDGLYKIKEMLAETAKNMKDYWNKRYVTDFCEVDITPSEFVKRTAERINGRKIKNILDLGCGAGRDSLYFANLGYQVTAVDLSDKALSLFQEKPQNVSFICEDMQSVKLPKNSFDMVYANLSLHYFDDVTTKKIIANLTQSLTENGVLIFLCKSTKDPLYGQGVKVESNVFDERYRHHFFDEKYIKKLLAGYEIERIEEREGFYYKPCVFIEVLAVKKKD